MTDRGVVHLSDLIVTLVVLAAAIGTAPIYYDMIGDLSSSADPFSQLLLQLVVPFIFIAIVISVGVSAMRRI